MQTFDVAFTSILPWVVVGFTYHLFDNKIDGGSIGVCHEYHECKSLFYGGTKG